MPTKGSALPAYGEPATAWPSAGDLRPVPSEPSILTYRVADCSGLFCFYLLDVQIVSRAAARRRASAS